MRCGKGGRRGRSEAKGAARRDWRCGPWRRYPEDHQELGRELGRELEM